MGAIAAHAAQEDVTVIACACVAGAQSLIRCTSPDATPGISRHVSQKHVVLSSNAVSSRNVCVCVRILTMYCPEHVCPTRF